jgi:hypothetical protein
MPNEAPSLRETLESAIAADAEPAFETAPVETEAAPEPVETQPEPQETAAEAAQRARDEKGRFAQKPPEAKAAAPKPAEPAKPAPAAEAKPLEPKPEPVASVKAPQSFKPAVRELAQKLPAEFRPILEESLRIDNEAKRALNDSHQARQFATQVQQQLAPYETIARANGTDAMTWAGSALQMVASLYAGTPQQRAQTIANAISMSGADIDAINAVMQGQAPQGHAAPQQQSQDVSRLVQQEFQRVAQEAQQQRATNAWEEFQASAPEFLEDVKDDMRFILEREGAAGRNMTYQQAYDRACKLNEGVSATLEQRKSTAAVRAQAPTVQRAKVAGSSIRATPAATATRPAGPRSLRETIEEAVAAERA